MSRCGAVGRSSRTSQAPEVGWRALSRRNKLGAPGSLGWPTRDANGRDKDDKDDKAPPAQTLALAAADVLKPAATGQFVRACANLGT